MWVLLSVVELQQEAEGETSTLHVCHYFFNQFFKKKTLDAFVLKLKAVVSLQLFP